MRSRGFTLLEVLVALAVVALSLAALIKVASSNASNAAYLQEKTLAHWVGMNKIAELQVQHQWPDTGTQRGTVMLGGQEWRWVVKVQATPDQDVRRLDVSVQPDARRNEDHPAARLVAFLGRPL